MTKPKRIVGGLLVRGGRLLLGKRSDAKKEWPGAWDMPGGHVKKGESFERALLREIEEEIGVVPERFAAISSTHTAEGEPYVIFRVDRWSGGTPTVMNDEQTELAWFTPQEGARLHPLADERYRTLFGSLGLPSADSDSEGS